MTPLRMLVAAGVVLLVVAVTSAAAGNLRFETSFDIRDRAEACPPEYPADTTTCRVVTARARVRGLGLVTITQRSAVQEPGFQVVAWGTLDVVGMGELAYRGDNSRTPGRNRFDFTFSSGTGRLAGATGGGAVTNSLTQNPTAFWEASLVAPNVTFDLAPPILAITRASARRANGRTVVTVAYTVRDASFPVALRLSSGTRAVNGAAARSGTATLVLPARPKGSRIVATLSATDAVQNRVARTVSVRA